MFTTAEIRRNVCAELEQLDRQHLRQLQEILLRQTHEQQSLQRRLFLKYYDKLEERPLIGLESMIMEFPRQLVLMTCYERIEEDFEKKVLQLKADLEGELKRLRDELEMKREKMIEDQQKELADLRRKHTDELQKLSTDMENTDKLVEEHQQQIVTMEHRHNDENRELVASLLGKEFYLRKSFEVNVRSLKARLDKNLDTMPRMEPVVLLEPQRYLQLRREAREQRRMLQQKAGKQPPEEEMKEVKEVSGGSQEIAKPLLEDENEENKKRYVKDQDEEKYISESDHKEEEKKATEEKSQDEKTLEHPESPPTEAPREADADLEANTGKTEVLPKCEKELASSSTTEVATSKGSAKNPVNFQEAGPKTAANRSEETKPMAMQSVAFYGLGPRRLPAMPAIGPFRPPSPSPSPIVFPPHYQPGYYYPPMVGFNGQSGGAGSYHHHPYVHTKNPFTLSHPQGVEPSVRMGDHSGHGPQPQHQPAWPHQLNQPMSYPQQTATMWRPNTTANASYGPMGSMQPNAILLAASSPQHTQFPIASNFNTPRPAQHYEHATNWFVRQPTHCGPAHTLHARPNCSQPAPDAVACINPSSGAAASPQPTNYPKYNTALKQVAQIAKTPNKQYFPRRPPKKQRVSPKDLITLSPPPQKDPVNPQTESTPEKRITILTNPNRSSNSRSSKREHEKKKLCIVDSFNNEKDEYSGSSLRTFVEGKSQNKNEIVNKKKEAVDDNREPS